MSKKLLTAEEIAREFNVSTSTVTEWGRQGKIPRIKISPKIIRYEKDVILHTLTQVCEVKDKQE